MTAIRRLLTVAACVLVIGSMGVPLISGQMTETPTGDQTPTSTPTPTPTQSQQTPTPTATEEPNDGISEDGTIEECTTIQESGHYELESTIEHDGSDVCLTIETSGVTIDGNGHELQGDRDDSIGMQMNGGWDGDVELTNMRFYGWGEVALDNREAHVTIGDSEFDTNTIAYRGDQAGGVTMGSVDIINTYSTAISGQMIGDVRLHDVRVINGGGNGLDTMNGANLIITNSEFSGNDGNGLDMGQMTTADISNTEITDNGESGVWAASAGHSAEFVIEDSTITDNGEHGLDARLLRSDQASLTVENTEIDDNLGMALFAYDGDNLGPAEITFSNVDLGGGLDVSFEDQFVTVGTHGAPEHETDALNFTGSSDADITALFSTGGAESVLEAEMSTGWQERGSYDSGGFRQVIGPGVWAASDNADAAPTETPQQTSTPTQTETPPEPMDSPEPPANRAPDQPTETQSTPISGGETSRNGTDTPTNTSERITAEPIGATEDDTEAAGGGPLQWIAIAAALILLLATLVASLVSWSDSAGLERYRD